MFLAVFFFTRLFSGRKGPGVSPERVLNPEVSKWVLKTRTTSKTEPEYKYTCGGGAVWRNIGFKKRKKRGFGTNNRETEDSISFKFGSSVFRHRESSILVR